MNILVTGGTGFIGKSIIPLLQKEHTVLHPTHVELDLLSAVDVKKYFSENKIDAVIHAAVVGGKRNVEEHMSDMTQNLVMFKNLTLQMMGTKRPFINFGSGAEYYHNTYYAASKREIYELGLRNPYYYHIRVFGCFGIHEEPQRFIKSALTNYINKQPIVIHGNKRMDFIYIDDLYIIIQNILNGNLPSGEYNAVYDSDNDLYELAQFINGLDDYNVDIIVEDIKTIDYTCSESEETFNSYNFTGMFNGIKIMYNQMKENING